MPKARGSVKSRRSGTKKGWPSKTRSYPWRTGSARPVLALSGVKAGRKTPTSIHRFTRWCSTINVGLTSLGGGVANVSAVVLDGGTTNPINVGALATTFGSSNFSFGGTAQFSLGNVPSSTDFSTLFDHYTLEQVDVEIDCLQNTTAALPGTLVEMPSIMYVPDFDDAALPSSGSQINEYQRARTWTFRGDGKPLKFSIKPRTAIQVFRSAVTTAYAAGAEGTPLNIGYTDVPHYGFKFWVDNMALLPTVTSAFDSPVLRVKMKYHMKFQDPK